MPWVPHVEVFDTLQKTYIYFQLLCKEHFGMKDFVSVPQWRNIPWPNEHSQYVLLINEIDLEQLGSKKIRKWAKKMYINDCTLGLRVNDLNALWYANFGCNTCWLSGQIPQMYVMYNEYICGIVTSDDWISCIDSCHISANGICVCLSVFGLRRKLVVSHVIY